MKEESKVKALRLEEKEQDQAIWDSIQGKEMIDVSWVDVDHVGRKLLKERLKAWAESVADEFWMTHYAYERGDGVPKEYGVYGVRVIEGKWTISIDWYYQTSRKNNRNPNGGNALSKSIKLPEGRNKMSRRQFGKAKEWEWEAIEKAEQEFRKIRECMNKVKAMYQAVRSIRHIMSEMPEGMKIGESLGDTEGGEDI